VDRLAGNNYTQQMLVQLQSGGLNADVITLIPDGAFRLVQAGVLRPIDDLVAKLKIHPSPAHNYLRKNGHLYGINTVEVPFAITYNKKLTDAAGIHKLATNPTEWLKQLKLLTTSPPSLASGSRMPHRTSLAGGSSCKITA